MSMDILYMIGVTEFEAVTIWKLFLASLCGAFVGFEREKKGSAAGIKTFSAVGIGSALAMIANEYIMTYLAGGTGDAGRMAAQVISGIGFLGAGTIMVTGADKIRGLTTAAALWVTASVGISIGRGFYFGGIACVIILTISTMIYRKIDLILASCTTKLVKCVDGVEQKFMEPLILFFSKSNIRVIGLIRKKERKWFETDTCMVIELELPKPLKHKIFLEQIRKIEGIRYCEEQK